MTPKHPLPRSSSPCSEPPRKRRHTTGVPSSPFSFSYPYVSSSPAGPSDSPSNPFGRTYTWNLLQTLPAPTSFSKHLPLRFQYVKRGVSRETREGIYRVVQVPQSYTLLHLKSLIAFLFGGAYGQIPPSPDDDEVVPGHVFELKTDVSLYPPSFKMGQIMTGTTWTYSSSALDPYLYHPDWESEDGPTPKENTEEVVEDERKWMAEEDLTIAHAWPEGGDITRGIVYKHAPNLQIHITINTNPISSRRGKGNLPHVFSACGLVYLEDPSEDDELEDEDRTALLDPENWNDPEDAFAKYYRRHIVLPFGLPEASASVPSLTFSSSPLRASSLVIIFMFLLAVSRHAVPRPRVPASSLRQGRSRNTPPPHGPRSASASATSSIA
ncbi:hypothetical protein MSAN_02390800 [Mycena sanguinolenta]|uniref:Uncharacterized protein n=1 Tax=Mycena sanguinolenta TaxID=230812 RepID=A0A8H6X4G1_9AGAR|nr:hypothetical protein MSAN_02390800 [Mycena sanguinolenta]